MPLVSSSSESSSDSEGSSSPSPTRQSRQADRASRADGSSAQVDDLAGSDAASPAPAVRQTKQDPEQAFESFYLRQSTKEFSEDLEKLRNANDFRGQSSVELLVGALKQGTSTFAKDERTTISEGK